MASWTDIIPQFKPYVEQLPVEAMVKVGMQKQALYEEGVKKIQSQIDSVSGLDIIRDVDKNYLQSKLDEMGNGVRGLAAADFSNFQLVNSVTGMTKQITKDKNIQTAIQSTAWYRKQAAAMEESVKSGKSSQSNIWDFNNKANQYISSTDLGRSFSDRYTPYTDVRKKSLDAIKALHPNLQSSDIPFEILPDGSINTKKIADAMVRNKVEGISENQIKQAIFATLDENDQNQLSIDGRYRFKDITPEQLGNSIKNNYESNLKEAKENLQLLASMKKTNVDPKKAGFIDEQINYYTELIGDGTRPGSLYENYQRNAESARRDPDGVKANMYKDAFVKEFANAFSWKNEEKQLLTNPYKQQENWAAEMRQKQYEFAENKRLGWANYSISAEKLRLDKLKFEQETAEKIANQKAKEFLEKYGTLPPPQSLTTSTMDEDNASEVFNNYVSSVQGEINGDKATLARLGFNDGEINKYLNLLKSNRSKEIDERALPSIIRISKKADLITQLQDVDRSIQAKVGGKEDPGKKATSDFLNSLSEGPFGLLAGKIAAPIYDIYSKFTDETKKAYNRELSRRMSNMFIPTLRAVGVKEDGTLTGAAITGLSLINEKQIAAGLPHIDPDDEVFTDKNVKNTKAYVKQNGNDYFLVVKNSELDKEYEIPVSANDIATSLGSVYLNNTQDLSMRIAMSPDLSSSVIRNPNLSYFQQNYGDFPNINKLSINSTLLADPDNPGTFIYEAYPLKKDGTRVPIRLSGKNGKLRLGFEQSLQMNNNLTDQEFLNMIMEKDPSFNIKQLYGVD